jgi:diketogulonate reductase-like aldo/keto reductase
MDAPRFFYGTAWKEERTEPLVEQALAAGFRAIDTANQRKHYHEAGVGAALRKAFAAGLARESLFIQTKFTYAEGQDHRLPFDPRAPYATQVEQSFASSLEHLGVTYIDSLLIHGPLTRRGWSDGDLEVWRKFEELQRAGRVRFIGVSNVAADQVATLCELAAVKPAFVQNRCYARLGWDAGVREVCRANAIRYQGFSLLTANAAEINSAVVGEIAAAHGVPRTRLIFAFALQAGMIALTGTTNRAHMEDDLKAAELRLSDEEFRRIEQL